MKWLSELRFRLRALVSRRAMERELDDELRDHLERDVAHRVKQGMPAALARREALRVFGGVERWKDEARAERGTQVVEEGMSDAKHSLRLMRRSPGFSLVVIATLAIGVGASTTIFSVVDGVLLKPLPYRNPEELVAVWQNNYLEGVEREEPSPANFLDWEERNTAFAGLASAEPYSVSFATPDGPQREKTWLVSKDFFETLGTAPLLGRVLQPTDYVSTCPQCQYINSVHALVIGYGIWQRRYGGDPGIVGRQEVVDGEPAVIVGVMPRAFAMPPGREMWAPKIFAPFDKELRARTYYQVIGRLKPGVTMAAASSDMQRIAGQLEVEYPRTNTKSGVTLVPLAEQVAGSIRGALLMLMAAAGLLLLIACANVANLMLSRAIDREGEFGLRAALGARRGRIIRQLLGESAVFGLIGGALGVALSWGGVAVLRGLAPASLPRVTEMGVDPRVLTFALIASLGTALLFGIVPALQLGRVSGDRTLQSGSARATGGSARQRRLRSLLVSGEVALSITLLVGAALLGRSFWSLLHVDKGYRTEGVLTVSMFLYDYYSDTATAVFVRQSVEKLKSLPGVTAAGTASDLPLAQRITRADASVLLEGQPEPLAGQGESVGAAEVSPGFFETLGIRLLDGRVIDQRDDEKSLPVTVINSSMAKKHWPSESAVGKRIRVQQFGKPVMRQIVGVVADVRQTGLEETPGPRLYVPHAQSLNGAVAFVIRTSGSPEALIPAVRRAFRELNPALPLEQFSTLDGLQSTSLQSRRFVLVLMTTFAATALLLAAIGVFGLLSRIAAERTKEFGVRMALGADRNDILRMVLRQGGILVGSGVVAGLLVSVGAAPLVGQFLYGVSPFDGSALFAAAVAMGLMGAIASALPALRATRTDPMRAIRAD